MRKIVTAVAAGVLALSLAACGQNTTSTTAGSSGASVKGTIGVAMPTKTSERWIKDGDNMKKQLEAAGYTALRD